MVEYPIFDIPLLGGSLLIAAVAIPHAFIAHFSVGATVLMASAERKANRNNDTHLISFLKKYSVLVLLVPYVLGVVSGAGIWFTTALVNPRALSILIHQFVWDWAIEWVLFLIEGVAIYLYVFRWDKMSPRAHNRLGWIFAGCSVATLVIINAILSFMLTTGSWQPFNAGILNYKAIFNPTYLPTTLGRILISLALAGVGAIVLVSFSRQTSTRTRQKVVALAYKFILPSILCLPLAYWTFTQLSARAQSFLTGGAKTMTIFLGFGLLSFVILFLVAGLSLLRKRFSISSLGALLLCLLAFVSFGSLEFVREGIRKPYVIEGFMYSTGLTHPDFAEIDPRANVLRTKREGVLSAAPWALPPGKQAEQLDAVGLGQAVYQASCLRCHSVDGYNAIRPLVRGWEPEMLRLSLDHLHEREPAMPDFPGNDQEKQALVKYLSSLNR